MTFEDFRRRIRNGLIISELIHENVPEPIISPRKIETYYQEHHDNYKLADQVKMRMIVSTRAKPRTACANGARKFFRNSRAGLHSRKWPP